MAHNNNILLDRLVQDAAKELEGEVDARRKARNKRKAARRKARELGIPDKVVPAGLGINLKAPRLEMIRSTASKSPTTKGSIAKDKVKQMKKAVKTEKSKVSKGKKRK